MSFRVAATSRPGITGPRSEADIVAQFRVRHLELVRLAALLLGDAAAAEDVVQDVFARVWEGRDRLAGSGFTPAYFYRAVVRGRRPADFWIYRFRITSSGRATRPAAVSGGLITGQKYLGNVGGFVVSPDGSRLALAVASTAANAVQSGLATEILVIDLRTGAHATWRGGMDRPGQLFGVQNLSWTRGGEALAYQGQWCRLAEVGSGMDTGYTCVKWSSQVASRYDGTDVVREISVTPGDRTGRYVLAWMTGSANGRQLHGWVQGGAYHRLAPAPTLYGATLQMTW